MILRLGSALFQNQQTKDEFEIDARVHSRLIGSRGWSIRKIMDEFRVEIRFPKTGASNPNLVSVIGSEDAVFNAKDHLLNLEEEYVSTVWLGMKALSQLF